MMEEKVFVEIVREPENTEFRIRNPRRKSIDAKSGE